MYFLASNIELDIETSVLYIAHRQVMGTLVKFQACHLLRRAYQVDILQRGTIAGLYHYGIELVRHFDQGARMADEIGKRNGQAACRCIGSSHSFVANQANS